MNAVRFLPDIRRFNRVFHTLTALRRLSILLFLGALLRTAPEACAQSPAVDGWFASQRVAETVHFFFSLPARVERYDLASRSWLPAVELPAARGEATAAGADADGWYVAYGKACYRYDGAGQSERFIHSNKNPVLEFHSDGNLLFMLSVDQSSNSIGRFTSVNKTTGAVIVETEEHTRSLGGGSIIPGLNLIVGRTIGGTPEQITFLPYNDDGTFSRADDRWYPPDLPAARRTWAFPGGARVVDDSGTVYNTGDLNYAGSFGEGFEDIAFRGEDVPVLLRGRELTAFDNALRPTGTAPLSAVASRIFIHGGDVLAFRRDTAAARGLAVEAVPLTALSAPAPEQPIDPEITPYTPDGLWMDRDGAVLILNRSHRCILRWNPATQSYAATIPLPGAPLHAAYSSENHRLYTAYGNGEVRWIDLSAAEPRESVFTTLPVRPGGLTAAGRFLVTAETDGTAMTLRTFNPAGAQISTKEAAFSKELAWSSANRSLYFAHYGISNRLHRLELNENGAMGESRSGPFPGVAPVRHTIRVEPDGSRLILGTGMVFDAATLVKRETGLTEDHIDGVWAGGSFWSLRDAFMGGEVELREWSSPDLTAGRLKKWPGRALRITTLPDGRLLVISQGFSGVPSLHILDSSLNPASPAALATPRAPVLSALTAGSITLRWLDVTGESGYEIERRVRPGAEWTLLDATGMSRTEFKDSTTSPQNTYAYRVTAVNGALRSAPSAELQVRPAPPPAPDPLTARIISPGNQTLLSWREVKPVTGYEVEYRSGTSAWISLGVDSPQRHERIDRGLPPGLRKFFRVRALSDLGNSPWSAEASVRIPAPVPGVPSITPFWHTSTSILLRWSATGNVEKYVLETRPAGTETWLPLPLPWDRASGFDHTGLTPGSTHEYRVRAVSEDGESGWSAVFTETAAAPFVPATPELLSVTAAPSGAFVITWADVAGETRYGVERRINTAWEEIARPTANATTHTDDNFNGTAACYRVRAVNSSPTGSGSGYSPYSVILCGTAGDMMEVAGDGFDGSPLPPWRDWTGARVLRGEAGLQNGGALWFGLSGPRAVQTLPLALSRGTMVHFAFRAGNEAEDSAVWWSESKAGEDVVLTWSTDGVTWEAFPLLNLTFIENKDWRRISVRLPTAAASPFTRLRWQQPAHSGAGKSVWAIDDVSIHSTMPEAPSAPVSLRAAAAAVDGRAAAALSWESPSGDGALVYEVERSAGGSGWTAVASLPAARKTFTDAAVEPASAYSHRVRGRNAGGVSLWSPVASVFSFSAIQAWRAQHFGSPDSAPGTGDFDRDAAGMAYIMRFAFDLAPGEFHPLDPAQSAGGGLPLTRYDETRKGLLISFLRPRAGAAPGVECRAEFSSDGVTWTPAAAGQETVTAVDSVRERVECFDLTAPAAAKARFARVRVSRTVP